MAKQQKQFPGIESLTMYDIVEWAGEKVAARGRDYQRSGSVQDLCITVEGVLLADVEGSELYSVAVISGEDNRPESFCSCPYGVDCKHGVAALLEYLERLNKGKTIPEASFDDPRLQLLGIDPDEDAEQREQVRKQTGKDTKTASPAKKDAAKMSMETYLSGLSKKQLITKILNMAKDIPQVRSLLQEEARGHKTDNARLLKNLRKEIQRVSEMEAWSDYWSGEDNIPDYSGVRKKMRILLDAGCFDGLLDEGVELLRLGKEQVDSSSDEGETAEEIANCVPLLVEALRASARPVEEKLLWALDAVLEDEFGLCDDLVDFLQENHPQDAWNVVIESLEAWLQKMPSSASSYRRDILRDWLIHALKGAGRNSEILPLYEGEAEATGDYLGLINYLVEEGKDDEALQWIQKAMEKTEEKFPGHVRDLRGFKRKIYKKHKDWPALLVLEIEDFIHQPYTEKFTQCRVAAEANKVWPEVRETLLDFLVSGTVPHEHAKWPSSFSRHQIPLNIKYQKSDFPMLWVLVDIAMEEKKPEDVYRWYTMLPKRYYHSTFHDDVALAIQKKFPEQSIGIWKKLAEGAVALAKKSAYAEAGGYLRKMRKLMYAKGMEKDWLHYATSLRAQHARKRLFLEVLDSMEEKPILRR